MTESSVRNIKIGCGVFVFLFFGSVWTYFHFASRARMEAMRGAMAQRGRGEPIASTETPRMVTLRQAEYRDPERALSVADAILAQPKDDVERRAALSRLPALLQSVALHRLRAGQRAEAWAARERLEQTFPASPQAGTMRREWRQALVNVAVQTLRDGSPEAAEAAFRELWAVGVGEPERYSYRQWLDTMQGRWRGTGTPAATPEADAQRELMAMVIVAPERTNQLAMDLANGAPATRPLIDRGNALARSERSHAALGFWQAAIFRAERGDVVNGTPRLLPPKELDALKADLRRKLGAGWIALGDRLRKGEPAEFVLISPREAYEGAARANEGTADEMEALVRILEFTAGEVATLAKPVLDVSFVQLNGSGKLAPEIANSIVTLGRDVREKIVDVMRRHGARLWQCCVDTPGFDPWPSVPPSVREGIDGATGPGGKPAAASPEAERRQKLIAHYRGDFVHIPLGELEPLRAVLHQVLARWALVNVTSNPEDAFTLMREVLRESPNAELRAELANTLRFRTARSGKAGDFNQFYLLAGFYASEVGLPAAGDPFRAEFRSGLEAAAESFRVGGRMKRIFILSLLAQCFPDESVGQRARSEAFAAAFDAVSTVPAQSVAPATLPTTLSRHSVELINNSTDHHLLLFYRSANEAISVHQWPWRRGTVVLPDGEYEIAVLSPAASIRPFRGKGRFESGMRISNYVISTSGGKNDGRNDEARSTVAATGDYKLLYAPAAVGAIAVEPRLGFPLPARAAAGKPPAR